MVSWWAYQGMYEIFFGLHPEHMDQRKSTLILSHRLNYQGAGRAGESGR
jgi:hypothetical protein